MKNKIDINFLTQGSAEITTSINDKVFYVGPIINLQTEFDILGKNYLSIKFLNVMGQIEITEIFYNNLSIEHFIYKAMFTPLDSSSSYACTHINRDGIWIYEFDRDLAKQIIDANTLTL
jgi:hypothetical protein